MSIHLKRTAIVLKPDQTRVLLRPFDVGDSERQGAIISRIMALPEEDILSFARGGFRRVLRTP